MNYNPLTAPFELPFQILTARCVAERAFYLPPRPGATPGSTLSGAFGTALWSAACRCRSVFPNPCLRDGAGEPACQNPDGCSVPWLYKPYSEIHRLGFTRPVLLRAEALEGTQPVQEFDLQITLWGRHAVAALEDVKATLDRTGELGLNCAGEKVRFRIERFTGAPVLTLAQRLERLPAAENVMLEFHTPFLHQQKRGGVRQFHTASDLPLGEILGNAAYTLAAWDMEDRNAGETLDKTLRHNLCRDARYAAHGAAERVSVKRAELTPVDIGERSSRSTGQQIPLYGFVGFAELGGALDAVMPWLLPLVLAGGGQKRALGFGTVRIWLEPGGCATAQTERII